MSKKQDLKFEITNLHFLLLFFLLIPALRAAEPPKVERAPREIYVPFDDLNVLLEQQPKRVMLSREEYDELLKKAKKSPDQRAPQAATIVSAEYDAKLAGQRAEIRGTLGIDVLEDGLAALPLDIGGVGLRSAKLDGNGASLGQGEGGTLMLFVEGKGRHELQLEMVAPLASTSAKQKLQYRLPRPPAAKMRMTVPGDVEIKSGAAVIQRTVEGSDKDRQTRFELLPREGDVALEMSLNSHLERQSQAFAVRSVLIDEITEGYEKLHAAVALQILHRPMDQFRFALPEGFEITEITAPLLARWDVQQSGGKKVVNVKLREQTGETVVLNLSALRTPSRLTAWQSPALQPLPPEEGASEAIAQSAIVGLMVEDRLQPETLETGDLIAIDAAVLGKALPESLAHPAPGTPTLKPVAAYYAPEGKFKLSGKFVKPPVEIAVNTSLLWRISNQGFEVLGGFTLLPRGEKLFSFDFSIPPDWTIATVTAAEEKPLKFDRFGSSDKAGRVRVYVPQGMAADREFKVNFRAVHAPQGWLAEWKSAKRDFPAFAVAGAIRDEGAIAIEARDDIVVRPETLKALVPLDDSEKAQYGLEGVAVNLAYRYELPQYAAAVVFERTAPRLSARTFSFLRISPEGLNAHYEAIYNIEEARTQNLALLLPENTPHALSIRGLDGAVVKEFTADPAAKDKMRRWRVLLAEPKSGKVRLAVDFQQPLPTREPKHYALPIIAADGVIYQSGLIAVEGCAEFDVQVAAALRKVDVGELVDADYQPGRRLLGVYGFAGNPPEVKIDVARNPGYPIYAAIVQKAELVTHLSPDGESHTEANFSLRTKALYLELQLPTDSALWSAAIDGAPIKPQREKQSILIGLPAATSNAIHELKIVYRTPTPSLGMRGDVELAGPKLRLRGDRESEAVEVPLADLKWKLCLPSGYEVVRSTGTVTTDELDRPAPAAMALAGSIYDKSGGVGKFGLLTPASQYSRESARRVASKSAAMINEEYDYSRSVKTDAPVARPAEPQPADELAVASPAPEAPAEEAKEAPPPPAAMPSPPADQEKKEAGVGGQAIVLHEQELQAAQKEKQIQSEFGAKVEQKEPASFEMTEGLDVIVLKGRKKEVASVEKIISEIEKKEKVFTVLKSQETSPSGARVKLSGMRSLQIALESGSEFAGRTMTFKSLGAAPVLRVELADRERFDMLGWGVAIAAFLIGVALSRRPAGAKIGYVILLAIIATIVPAVWDCIATAWVCNLLFFAACWLVPYYLITGLLRCVCSRCCCRASEQVIRKTAAAALLLAICMSISIGNAAHAQEAPKPGGASYIIQVVEPGPPVAVPDDAIIVPYDAAHPPILTPEEREAAKKSDKLLLPYEKYVELWNRAYPDKKIETKKPPADYALAGATYKTTLEGDEFLLVTGELEIDVFSGEFVQIPLGLGGGVLAQATLDGKPARLSLGVISSPASPSPQPNAQQAQQSKTAAPPGGDPRFFLLALEGKGRHKLEIGVRLKLTRDGGWRSVDGLLPAAPASACAITVPLSQTEVRLARLADQLSYDTEKPGETISTALGPGGALAVRWRAKAAETKVDLALAARSEAVLDVQEDGLRWTWQLNLDFRGKTLEEFAVEVPAMYVVEKIEGGNVRGWQAEKSATAQTVKIALLKAAKDREQILLVLSRAAAIGQGNEKELSAGMVRLNQAALHTGRILFRRSPLLDLRTLDRAGMTRTDIPQDLAKQVGAESTASPLNVRPFEAYVFDRNPAAAIRLAAEPTEAKATAEAQSILKITDANRTLDSRILFHVKDRPVYRLQMYLPDDFRLDRLSPGDLEHAITAANGRRLLTIWTTSGLAGDFEIRLQGTLGKQAGLDNVPLPRLEMLGVERQQGDLAVQASDAYEVAALDLTNCERVMLDRFYGWLKPEQRTLTRLALQYRAGDYAGAVRLAPKKPEVTCDALTNVRITNRAIEETILLDYTIKNAGVRKFSFILPWWMKDAKINVPLLREKSNEPLDKSEKSPRLVKIELQVEAMGQHRVLVENDRQLENTPQEAPIPKVNDVSACRRCVTLESYGRDEIVVAEGKLAGMEKLLPGQKEWGRLKDLLGRAVTYAYLIAPDAAEPKLVFQANERSALETTRARIGLAITRLLVDENGAYRAELSFNMFNTIEQFLEIELPLGAELWTAQVAGEPVKPARLDPKDPRGAKIPLVKTAAGDLDYQVVLRYGGRISAPGTLATISFPLARCVNVTPESSTVKLYLPKDRRWFDFGGTMRQVAEEADLVAQVIAEDTKQIGRLQQTMQESQGGSKFGKIRASENMKLKQIGLGLHNSQDARRYSLEANASLSKELAANEAALQATRQDVAKFESAAPESASQDNREKLREYYSSQTNTYAGKTLVQTGSNWGETPAAQPPSGPESGKQAQQFNDAWLAGNKLLNPQQPPAKAGAEVRKGGGLELRGQAVHYGPQGYQTLGKPSAAQVVQGKGKRELSESSAQQQIASPYMNMYRNATPGGGEQGGEELRYKDRYARQQTAQTLNLEGNKPLDAGTVPERYSVIVPPSMTPGGQPQTPGFAPPVAENAPAMMGGMRGYGAIPESTSVPSTPPTSSIAPFETNLSLEVSQARAVQGGLPAVPAATGLASLELQFPFEEAERWSIHRFTTPRGDTEITARSISDELLRRVGYALGAIAAILLIGFLARRGARRGGGWIVRSPATTSMIVLGILAVFLGVFPVLGIVAIVAGIALKIASPGKKAVAKG
ncbi:MAG: hypothetical protein IT426_19415 [Pirellulales bacterium]|nr:hypothetical protein [Pirellulales bacterium]